MDYKDSVNSRFVDTCNQLIDSKRVVNKTQLAESLGIRSNKFSEILMGRMRAGVSEIQKLCNNYGVSFDYIFNGNRECVDIPLSSDLKALKENEEKNFQENVRPKMSAQNVRPNQENVRPKCPPKIEQNSKYDTSTEKNFQQFDHPKLTTQTDHPKPDFDHPKRPPKTEIATRDGAIQRNYHGATYVEAGGIPLIPIDAAAGILSGDNVQVMDYECDHYVIPAFHGADFLIRVAGDSMTPRYISGDLVACIRLAMVDFLQWNKSYIIDSAQGVLLKRVKRSEKPDHLLLVSENEEYDPFEIPTSEIRGLALVVGLIRIE